jgi:hypothetical protein
MLEIHLYRFDSIGTTEFGLWNYLSAPQVGWYYYHDRLLKGTPFRTDENGLYKGVRPISIIDDKRCVQYQMKYII